MKVEVKEPETVPRGKKFPRLMKSTTTGDIFLIMGEHESGGKQCLFGVRLSGKRITGQSEWGLLVSMFEYFTGEVIFSND